MPVARCSKGNQPFAENHPSSTCHALPSDVRGLRKTQSDPECSAKRHGNRLQELVQGCWSGFLLISAVSGSDSDCLVALQEPVALDGLDEQEVRHLWKSAACLQDVQVQHQCLYQDLHA